MVTATAQTGSMRDGTRDAHLEKGWWSEHDECGFMDD